MLQRPLRPLGLDSSGLPVVSDTSIHTVLKHAYISSYSFAKKVYAFEFAKVKNFLNQKNHSNRNR